MSDGDTGKEAVADVTVAVQESSESASHLSGGEPGHGTVVSNIAVVASGRPVKNICSESCPQAIFAKKRRSSRSISRRYDFVTF